MGPQFETDKLFKEGRSSHTKLGPVTFDELPIVTTGTILDIKHPYVVGDIGVDGSVTKIVFLTQPGAKQEYLYALSSLVVQSVDHVIQFKQESTIQYMFDSRPLEEARLLKGLDQISDDPVVLSLLPGATLPATLIVIRQANTIFLQERLLERVKNQPPKQTVEQSQEEQYVFGPLTSKLANPFEFMGIDFSTATEEEVIKAYSTIINLYTAIIQRLPKGVEATQITIDYLTYVKESFWFARKLLLWRRSDPITVRRILAMDPQQLIQTRERLMIKEAEQTVS